MGINEHPLYWTWANMLARCRRKNHPSFKYYGAVGIKVCARWHKFSNFLSDVGEKPSPELELDRINNAKGYYPGNVRWTTHSAQMRNTHRTHWVFLDGEEMCLSDAAEKLGIAVPTPYQRVLRKGGTMQAAIDHYAQHGRDLRHITERRKNGPR